MSKTILFASTAAGFVGLGVCLGAILGLWLPRTPLATAQYVVTTNAPCLPADGAVLKLTCEGPGDVLIKVVPPSAATTTTTLKENRK